MAPEREPAADDDAWRRRDDEHWRARRRWRACGVMAVAAAPAALAAGATGGAGAAAVATGIGVLLGGATALLRWSIPLAALGQVAGWLALGALARTLPILAPGPRALLDAHLLGVAAIAVGALAAAWMAADD